MNFSKIIMLIQSNSVTENDMVEYLQSVNLTDSHNFHNFYDLLTELKKQNNDVLISIFINSIANNHEFFLLCLKYMFSDKFHSQEFLSLIKEKSDAIDILNIEDFEIILDYFSNEANNIDLGKLKKHYFYLILTSRSLENVNFDYLADYLEDLIKIFASEFIITFEAYLQKRKDRKYDVRKFDAFFFKYFPNYYDVLYVGNVTYSELVKKANSLIEKAKTLGITECDSFSFDNDSMLAIYNYYQLTSDNSIPKELIKLSQKSVQYKMNADGYVRITSDIISGLEYMIKSSKIPVKYLIGFQDALNNIEQLGQLENKSDVYVDFLGFRSNIPLEEFIRNYQETLSSVNKYQFTNFEKYIFAYNFASRKRMTPFELTSLLKMINIPASNLLLFENGKLKLKTLAYVKDAEYGIDNTFSSSITDEFLLEENDSTLGTAFNTVNRELFNTQRSYRNSYETAFVSLGLNNEIFFGENAKKFLASISSNIPSSSVQNALINTLKKSNPFASQESIIKDTLRIMTRSGYTFDINKKLSLYSCYAYGKALFENVIITDPSLRLIATDSVANYENNLIKVDYVYLVQNRESKEVYEKIQKMGIYDFNMQIQIINNRVHITFTCPGDWILEEYIDFVQKRIDFISHELGYDVMGKDVYYSWESLSRNSK